MKTTRFALTAVLGMVALFGGAGCSQSLSTSVPGGVEHAGAFDEVLADRDPHATLAWNAAAHPLPLPARTQADTKAVRDAHATLAWNAAVHPLAQPARTQK